MQTLWFQNAILALTPGAYRTVDAIRQRTVTNFARSPDR
jgi:hypothetical protein